MALALITSTPYGVNANYHKIAELRLNPHMRISYVELWSFVSIEAREAGANPLAVHMFEWSGDEFPFQFDTNNFEIAYTKIKTLPEWSPAEDV